MSERTAFAAPVNAFAPSTAVTSFLSSLPSVRSQISPESFLFETSTRRCVYNRSTPSASFSRYQKRKNSASRKNGRPRSKPPIIKEILDAQKLRKRGQWQVALGVLEGARKHAGNDTNYLNEMLHVRAAELRQTHPTISASDLYDDLTTLSENIPAQPNVTTFNAILVGLRKRTSGKGQETSLTELEIATKIFDSMMRKCMYPDHFTMSILFQMCASARSLQHTQYFEKHAREAFGFEANVISGSSLLSSYARCGNVKDAERVLSGLQRRNVPINERTYASIISAYNRAGLHLKVLECFKAAHNSDSVHLNEFIFSGVMSSCGKARDSVNAMRVVQIMESKRVTPTAELMNSAFETAVRSGDLRFGAWILFEWMSKYNVLMRDTMHFKKLILSAQKASGPVQETTAFMNHIIDQMKGDARIPLDASIFNAQITALIGLGLYDEALRVVDVSFAEHGIEPDVATYNVLINCLSKAKQPAEAVDVFRRMRGVGITPDQITYNTLLEAVMESGNAELSERILKEMKMTSGIKIDSVALSSQLKLYRSQKNAVAAMNILRNAVREKNMLDSTAYGLVLSILFESSLEREAVSVFGWLLWKQQAKTYIFNIVIDHLGRKTENQGLCLQLFENMKNRGIAPDAITYTTLIRVYSQNGQLNRAFRLLGEMQDVGLGLSDSFAWTALIDGCGRAGQWQRAIELLYAMRKGSSGSQLVPRPATASYNAALYAAGMGGGGWNVVKDIYNALLEDEGQDADAITYSAMGSIILRNRHEVEDWDIVREVYDRLCELCRDNNEGEQNLRRTKRVNGSYRKLEKPLQRKLEDKASRLAWLMEQAGKKVQQKDI